MVHIFRAAKANKLNINIAITIKCSVILKLKIWIIFLPYIFSEISQMVRIKFSLLLSVIPHSPIQKYSITNSNIFSVAKNTIITPRDLKFKLFLSYMFCAIKQTLFFFFYCLDNSFLFKPRKTCRAEMNSCNLATGQDATATKKHKILPLKHHESTANYKKQI